MKAVFLVNRTAKQIAYGALAAALIMVATAIIKVPGPNAGYYHLGDGVLFVMAMLMGPTTGALSAGVGSALADLLAGYGMYAPVTFIIKACMGYVAGKFANGGILRRAIVFTLCEAIMVLGYFAFEIILIGFNGAVGDILLNMIQGLFGIVIGIALTGGWMAELCKGRFGKTAMQSERSQTRQAFVAAIPVILGYIPLGLSCGLLSAKAGLLPVQVLLLCVFLYAGGGQFMIASMVFSGVPPLSIAASVTLINARYMLYSSASANYFAGDNKERRICIRL